MNRREALGIVGTACGGILAGNSPATAGEHGDGARESAPPIDNIHLFFCGFHVAKHNTKIQFETHHFCSPRGDKMHQCLLYDSSDKHARLIGVEYIIADELFKDLPDAEKKFWHPHTYEVMSGGLIAPHMTRDGEDDFMKALINTWGKKWHTWPDPKTPVPMGEPLLMWSLTGDGQENLQLSRDRAQAVADVLSDLGIEDERIQVEGYGDQFPVDVNTSERGRAQNRRVEIVFSDEKGKLSTAR